MFNCYYWHFFIFIYFSSPQNIKFTFFLHDL